MDLRSVLRRVATSLRDVWSGERTGCDPIDHPEILRMTLRQLADLPFEPYVRDDCRNGGESPADEPVTMARVWSPRIGEDVSFSLGPISRDKLDARGRHTG